jgi:hypothetical protein
VDVRRAREVRSLEGRRAVVLGSAVYMARWRRDAMRLLRPRRELKEREVWLFSSGAVDEDKDEPDERRDRWTKPMRVEQLAAEVNTSTWCSGVASPRTLAFSASGWRRTFRPSCATGAAGARSRPGHRRSRTRCASYRLDPARDAMAEVTITTQPGELPVHVATVSSGGPRPGVVVIHDGGGIE